MLNYELIEKNKNKIINFGVVVLALVIAFHLYRSANDQVSSLIQRQNNELEKNKVVEDIAVLEKKAQVYQSVFVKKDLASVMGIISGIAKNTSVKVISVNPYAEDALENYLKTSFIITLNSPSYHALSDFISKIENHKDIYLVNEISINSPESNSGAKGAPVDLGVSLKVNTISYL